MVKASGFVLAGGKSVRIGRDKALLVLAGETLVERGLRQLAEVCETVAIAGGAGELRQFGRLIEDRTPGCGPLGGIVAALEDTETEWNVFVPVDVPFLPAAAWRALLEAAEGSRAAAVLARNGGEVQPLCGVYHSRGLGSLRESLAAGRWKVTAAVEEAGGAEYVDFEDAGWFRNVNTVEEFREVVEAAEV